MISLSLNKTNLRRILLIAGFMVSSFLIIDLSILPVTMQGDYYISRFAFQVPAILLMISFTYHNDFEKYSNPADNISSDIR